MRNIKRKNLTLSLAVLTGLTSFGGFATRYEIGRESRLGKQLQQVAPVREFHGQKPFTINDAFLKQTKQDSTSPMKEAVKDPSITYEKVPAFSFLEGPDGTTWFYTTEYEEAEVEHTDPDFGDTWTEDIIKFFTFHIYDSAFTEVGTIKGEIELAENETRPVVVSLDPSVTTNFFNTDDNLEVMVYIVMNTEEFVNHSYYKVYSIGGAKDEKGIDKPLATLEGRCIDVINVAGADGKENVYMTFSTDAMVELDSEYDNYIDFLNAHFYELTTFGKATSDDSGIKELCKKKIFCANVPGDTADGIYFISKPYQGKLYLVYSQYEKPYFVDPTGMAQDESATPDNALMIEVYDASAGEVKKVSATSLPVETIDVPDALIYTFMSIGSVAWTYDVDMAVKGTPEKPAFIVARDVVNAATYEEQISSYDLYSADGTLISNIAKDTEGMALFTDGDSEPQAMFVTLDEEGDYTFTFKGLYSDKIDFTVDQKNGGDPISASCDRVKQIDGKYKYAFEMTYYDIDEDDNEYARVAWFNADGTPDRIDKILIGKDVMAAAVNMASSMLNPYLFDDDDYMEYAVLIKRSKGQQVKNEFHVMDHNGTQFASFTEEDGLGLPYSFTILFGEPNRLMMIYNNNYKYNIELYDLPFLLTGSGVESIMAGNGENITVSFDGVNVTASGEIEVYDIAGVKVASGKGNVSLDGISPATYIVVVDSKAARKVVVK